ncbi:MAG TPA: acetate--CoA ligase family protein [Candidatus Limnocylindrales bacterium]|nr:acetate--CoA ligase family protein [Candidatus Limnocylindrales bacterium]
MNAERATVENVLAAVRADGRTALLAHEAAEVCNAYGIPVARQWLAESAQQAGRVAEQMGFPVALKIVSADILHKTEAGGVRLGARDVAGVEAAYGELVEAARRHAPEARIAGVLVQKMEAPGREVLIGGVTDPTFGKVVAFGLGGVLVEVLRDVTFRMTPVDRAQAAAMLGDIAGADVLRGVRGEKAVDHAALVAIIESVSRLLEDFPQIEELDLNPIFARPDGAVAVDARITIAGEPRPQPVRLPREQIVAAMRRILRPRAVAVIGASAEEGKIGNSVMKNLVAGGYRGAIYPIHPKAPEIMGLRAYKSVLDVEGDIDVAVFAIPARLVAAAMEEVGRKGIAGAVLIPSGFAEVGEKELQDQMLEVARRHGVRVMGPNIYGFYYTPENLCATFCTAYDVRGKVALSSQSGGVGMSIIGFSRSTRMGVSAIVGLGNKSDIDEDDLLEFFEQDENTSVIAMHAEDLKDGRAFAEAASRVSKAKPIVMLKAGRTALGARAAASHTGALAGNDKIYEDVLRQCGVVRARSLRDMLEFARGLSVLPSPKGENVVIVTGAGGSGVLLSDACVDNGLSLMRMPEDLDAAFRKFIPPFGAAGNPVDITGGEPPSTYRNTIALALEDPRIHSLILGYWHTIVTPPMVFAELLADVVERARGKGHEKPVVASLVGDVEVEQACDHLWERGIPAYPYTTEMPVAVLGAKYRWARGAGLL